MRDYAGEWRMAEKEQIMLATCLETDCGACFFHYYSTFASVLKHTGAPGHGS